MNFWKERFQFTKTVLGLAVLLSLGLQFLIASTLPLTVDEIHVWNLMLQHESLQALILTLRSEETHFPFFYLLSFFFFNTDSPIITLRLPSIVLGFSSLYFWSKIFNYKQEQNTLAWLLILFCPFVLMYKSLYLTYGLVIFTSILAYLPSRFSIALALPQALSHFYGLYVFLLRCFFERHSLKKTTIMMSIFTLVVIAAWFGVFEKALHLHTYREFSSPLRILGFFNLLFGGALSTLMILYLSRNKLRDFTWTLELKFLLIFVLTVTFFSTFINPATEARYFLVILVPLYRFITCSLSRGLVALFLIAQIIGAGLLFPRFGPSFMIDYHKVPEITSDLSTGLLITPCPRFFYRQEHIHCLDFSMSNQQLWQDNQQIIVHQDHLKFFESKGNDLSSCQKFHTGLYQCSPKDFNP